MDALKLLKQDHQTVKALFDEVLDLSERATAQRRRLFEQIDRELTLHAQIEERLFYPALREKASSKRDGEARDLVLEALDEHANVKAELKKLERLEPGDESYKAKLKVLSELVEHHVREEESEMFPQAKTLLGEERLDELGEQIEAAKAKAGASEEA